mgnify:CR=1 FL=1
MKKIKIGLLPRIIIAIILGIAIGTIFPAPLVRIFVTFNGIFSEFLNFSIPLIIVGLVTVAIADIGKGAGKMLLVTALIAYGSPVDELMDQLFPLLSPGDILIDGGNSNYEDTNRRVKLAESYRSDTHRIYPCGAKY